MIKKSLLSPLLAALLLSGCGEEDKEPASLTETTEINDPVQILFDDFSYDSLESMLANDWRVRTETGHPGVSGARWSGDGISFLADPAQAGNTLLRMTSSTGGSGENTQHTQFCHLRKYREGTYAARVFFRDEPVRGPDGDQVIETFYAISPLKAPMDPDYSEMDFEYLANGGWGEEDHALFATTWETFKLGPFVKDNEYSVKQGSFAGWHTLLLQVSDKTVRYFIDGEQFAEHSEHVYPEEPMSINFNLWFTQEGLIDSDYERVYQQDIDWVFHSPGQILDTEGVQKAIAGLRANKVAYTDTVSPWSPVLDSPCGL